MKSTTDKLALHLEMGRSITPLQALEKWGCMRLSARIHDLRRVGWNIVTNQTRIGNKTVAKYKLA